MCVEESLRLVCVADESGARVTSLELLRTEHDTSSCELLRTRDQCINIKYALYKYRIVM